MALAALARDADLSPESIRRIASGESTPLVTTALRIAAILNVEVEDIFGTDDVA